VSSHGAAEDATPTAALPFRSNPMATVTALRPPDRTNAERQRRYRARRRIVTPTVTPDVVVDTAAMTALAARLSTGAVTAADLEIAGRLVLALVAMLPPDGAIGLLDSPRSD
jgi:hypothetical protein